MGRDEPLSYAVTGNPAWLTLSGFTLSGTPDVGDSYTVTVTVTDNNGDTDQQSFTLDVVDTSPVLAPIRDFRAQLNVLFGNGFSPATGGEGTITYTLSGGPSWLSMTGIDSNGIILIGGTPTAVGEHEITVTVTDANGDSHSQIFTLRVGLVANTIPMAPGDTPSTLNGKEGESFNEILPAAIGGDLPLTYTFTGLPPGLSFSEDAHQIFGVPTADGNFQGLYSASDVDGDSGFAVTVTIVIADDPMPVLPSVQDYTGIVGDAFSETLPAATSGDAPLTYSLSNAPSWLSISDRVISGTPDAVGTHNITYIVDDNDGDTDTVGFTITVEPAVEANINTGAQTVSSEAVVQLSATATGSSLTYLWEADPDEGAFNDDAIINPTWTAPAVTVVTDYDITFTATDDESRKRPTP